MDRQKAKTLLVLAGLLILASCTRNNARAVFMPPPTDPLARDSLGYGVVTVSFTHVREEPGEEGNSLGYLRKGSLVKIIERRAMGSRDTGSWLFVDYEDGVLEGWLNENLVDVYDNESRAFTASQTLD